MVINDQFFSEDSQTEFKSCSQGRAPIKIQNTICAFSNALGGKIICGINSDGQSVHLNGRELDNLQLQINSICDNNFNIKIRPKMEIRDKYLIVTIEEAQIVEKPVFITKSGMTEGAYVRRGTADRRANENDFQRFIAEATAGAERRIFKVHYRQCLDFNAISGYQEKTQLQSFGLDEFLLKKSAVDEQGNVTLFGLLALSQAGSLQDLVSPAIKITITKYRGKSKINPKNLTETYLSSKDFEGNAVEQFHQVSRYLAEQLQTESLVNPETGLREDVIRIPETVLRELVANSIIHRDYSVYSSAINIDIYADRLEITNPGISLVDIDSLELSPSVGRNQLLIKYFKDMGIVEQQARGIRLIQNSLKQVNLPPARFENLDAHFKATVCFDNLINRHSNIAQIFRKHHLNQAQLTALIHLCNQDIKYLNNSIYRQINHMHQVNDNRRARQDLQELVSLAILRSEGVNKATKYYLQYVNPGLSGAVEFNYSDNNGIFTIGKDEAIFDAQWSKASDQSIHVCSDGIFVKELAVMQQLADFPNLEPSAFSSRCRTAVLKSRPYVVMRNTNDIFSIIKINKIQDDARGDREDLLNFVYYVQQSDDFFQEIRQADILK